MDTSPASIVIDRFGGIKAVADTLGLERTAVQRWNYPHPRGTGGSVPQRHWAKLIEGARASGIDLAPDDLLPPALRD